MEEDSPLGWTEVRSSCREGRHLAWMRSTLTLREVKKKKKNGRKCFLETDLEVKAGRA